MWRNSHYNEELLEEVHIIGFLHSIGITKHSLPRDHERFGDQYQELLNRLCLVSLELVHNIPLCRYRKPGRNSYSWVTDLNHDEKGKVNKNIHLFQAITQKNKSSSLLSVQVERTNSKVLSKAQNKQPLEVLPQKDDVLKTVKVFEFSIQLKKIRSDSWMDGLKDHCLNNDLYFCCSKRWNEFFR